MLFENKEKRYKTLLIFIIPLIVLLLVFGFLAFNSASSLLGNVNSKPKDTRDINEYDYHLRSNATDYQKELFNELEQLIDDGADDLAIAECVVKNYIADVYTWDNKMGQWDIGGMCYVYSPQQIAIYYQLKDNFYGLLNKYQDQYGKDGLSEVTNVEIEDSHISDDLYEVDGNLYTSFSMNCVWEYASDSRFASKIATKQYYKVIKNNDGRFEIVICHGDEY